ncbi:MAG: hypothetical protein H0U45_14130 [Tatlockia sp.]|nr:hypothetical protein [Tatlockia sp.]
MRQIFTCLTIIAGFITAIFWLCSALARVRKQNEPNQEGWINPEIRMGDINFLATIKLQSKWNTAAAIASAITGLFQILATANTP